MHIGVHSFQNKKYYLFLREKNVKMNKLPGGIHNYLDFQFLQVWSIP
jgi:hypothetical protein